MVKIKEKPKLRHHYIQFAHGKLNYELNLKRLGKPKKVRYAEKSKNKHSKHKTK